MSIQRSEFGVTAHGVTVHQFILKNRHQTEVCIINYGGIITSLYIPDRDGNRENIVLGFDEMRDRKSTRLNSSHVAISYAVFCLKKKKKKTDKEIKHATTTNTNTI